MSKDLEISQPISAGVATYPAGATFGPRVTHDFEFVWVIEGNVEYRWNEVVVQVLAGSVVLCKPGGTDFFRWDEERRTRHGYFHFRILSFPQSWPGLDEWPVIRTPVEGDVLRPLFRHLLTWVGKGDSLLRRITMAHMLTAFVTGEIASDDVPHDAAPEAVERASFYIHDRLEEDPAANISLADLARVACVSPEHLCRLFRTSTGRSPVETVRLARLDRAAVLLARSNYSVGEIATVCGFSSPFHFSRRFKAAFGQSPRDLRQKIASGDTPPTPRLLRQTPNLHR